MRGPVHHIGLLPEPPILGVQSLVSGPQRIEENFLEERKMVM